MHKFNNLQKMFDNKDNLNSEQQLSKHPFADIDDSSF